MKLDVQKKVISRATGNSTKRIKLDPARLTEIKEAITKKDLIDLVKDGAVKIIPKSGVSRGRARKHQTQKKKGRRKKQGTREGKKNARDNQKRKWMNKIRLQRTFLNELKDKGIIENDLYRDLYMKSKGGFFRSKRHIKLYLANVMGKK